MYPSFSKMVEVVRWSDTDASARRLVDCGDYDGDLYREDPLESEGGFGNIIVVDNLPVMPLENFAKLESVRCTIKKREARIFRLPLLEDAVEEAEIVRNRKHSEKYEVEDQDVPMQLNEQ